MKKFKIVLTTTVLTFAMTCSVLAKDITLKVEANKNGKVKVSGESKKNTENVTIKVEDSKKIYYLDQNKTNEKGEFQFKFEVDPNKDYKGRVNVGGEIEDFEFKTKEKGENPEKPVNPEKPEKPSKPSGGGSSSGGGGGSSSGGGGGSATKPSDDKKDSSNKNTDKNIDKKILEKAEKIKKEVKINKEDLKVEVKGNKNVVALKDNVLNNKINKLNEMIKDELKDVKDEKEKEALKKELSVVPIKVEEEKENVVLELGESEIKNMKNEEVGVKVDFLGAEIKVPYTVIEEVRDGERLQIRKSEVRDNNLENKVKGKEKVLAKLYKFDVVKLDGNSEKEVKLEDSTKIIIKVDDNKLNGVKKDTLKIAWYDEETQSWKTLKSQFIPEKNIVIGEM